MKTTLILTVFILFTALMGCSDGQGILEPQSQKNPVKAEQKHPDYEALELLWSMEELGVKATNESIVENKAVYTSPPFVITASYVISFDVYTNAGKFTNGYIPLVQIFKDKGRVYESSAFPDENGNIITPVKVRLDNVRFKDIKFSIALFQVDSMPEQNTENCILKLTNLRVFMLD